jgi:hypothetical protein
MKLKISLWLLAFIILSSFTAWADLSKTEVSQLYVLIFGRASEGEGNIYWQSQPDMAKAASAMLDTDAAWNYFGADLNTNQAFIEHIYREALNKAISDDFDGISYWVNMLNAGTTRGEVVAKLIRAINDYAPDGPYYDPNDAATVAAYNQFMNRVEISNYMADNVYAPPNDWEKTTSFNAGMAVTDDPASVVTAMLIVNGFGEADLPPRGVSITVPFQKGPNTVTAIYPINLAGRTEDHKVLLTTLQGLLAKQGSEQLYFYNYHDDYYFPNKYDPYDSSSEFIKNLLINDEKGPNIPKAIDADDIEFADAWKIVDHFMEKTGVISDYVLYDKTGTDMQNIAVTICGLLGNALPVSIEDESNAIATGRDLHRVMDLTTDPDFSTYPDNYFNLATNWKDDLNSKFIVELDPVIAGGPKDYAVMLNGMLYYTFWDADRRTQILNTINTSDPLAVFGWDADPNQTYPEYNFLESVSKLGGFVVASDQSFNLSLLSSTHSLPKKAVNAPPLTYECGMKYVVFIMSDGDNLQLLTNNINSAIWWGSEHRGKFPVGWTICPAMYYLEPDIWNYFMDTATENDEFLAGPSTIGYVMGMVTDDSNRSDHFTNQLKHMSAFLSTANLKTAMIFGSHVYPNDDWSNHDYIDPIANQTEIQGLFYKGYAGSPNVSSQFIKGKPVVSFFTEVNPVVQDISKAQSQAWSINDAPIDNDNKGFYAIYGVRNLHLPPYIYEENDLMGGFNSIYNALDKEKVRVVTPSQFIDLRNQAESIVIENTIKYFSRRYYVGFDAYYVIETYDIPEGYTVEWFSDCCGGTLVPGGGSPTVTKTGTYYGRMRPIDGGCPSPCVSADVY